MADTSKKDDAETEGENTTDSHAKAEETTGAEPSGPDQRPDEVGGPKGPEPTRYGDWEKNGIASDF